MLSTSLPPVTCLFQPKSEQFTSLPGYFYCILTPTVCKSRPGKLLVLPQSDKDGYDCHASTRKNKCHKILFSVSFRVLPWLLNKLGTRLNIVQYTLLSGLTSTGVLRYCCIETRSGCGVTLNRLVLLDVPGSCSVPLSAGLFKNYQ